MSSPTLKSPGVVKELLKNYLGDMGLVIDKEFETDESSGFWVKSVDFPILVENHKTVHYWVVALQITFSNDTIIKTVNERYEQQDHRFVFQLTQVLASPQTSFTRAVDDGRIKGFTIFKNIYPFHDGFTISDLDQAVQAVLSVGAVGVAFLKSEMGQMDLDHTPPRPASEPGPMYE